MIGMSYDIGTSKVRHGNSFEISLTYIPKAKVKRETTITKRKDQPEKLPPAKVKVIDTDKDGFPDVSDKCPDVPGTKKLKGCPEKKKEIKATKFKRKQTFVMKPKVVVQEKPKTIVEEKPVEVKVETPVVVVEQKPLPAVTTVIDTDNDGIVDTEDACPYIKGGIKTHGCPDSDEDGIVDMNDKCPMEAGTVANNGCPEKKENTIANTSATKTSNIEFETGKAVIKGFDVIDILEPASDKLWDDAGTTIIITGHTDSEGDAMTNMVLSQNRADAVKEYFIKHGVASSRIKTIAYGESMPLMNNDSEDGKQHNRRAEINIIKSVK